MIPGPSCELQPARTCLLLATTRGTDTTFVDEYFYDFNT